MRKDFFEISYSKVSTTRPVLIKGLGMELFERNSNSKINYRTPLLKEKVGSRMGYPEFVKGFVCES